MKYLLIIAIFTVAATLAFGKTIKEGDTEYQCSPVKTCDERLKVAYAEIARLKKQLKQSATVVTKTEVVEKVIEKTKIKKHIVSVLAIDSVKDVSASQVNANLAKASVTTGYIPAVTYQYQMDMGLTFLGGLSLGNEIKPLLGLGFEL